MAHIPSGLPLAFASTCTGAVAPRDPGRVRVPADHVSLTKGCQFYPLRSQTPLNM